MHNTRQVYEREEDNMPIWAKILYRYGVPSAIALFLVWVVATRILGAMDMMMKSVNEMHTEIHEHMTQTGFYMHSMCVGISVQSGQNPAVCDIPGQGQLQSTMR